MKTLITILTTLLINTFSSTNALQAFTVSRGTYQQVDVPTNPDEWTWIDWDYSILDIINLVNNYLRFAVGFVCFLFMIINGYKLITAHGDEKQSSSAMTGLMWSIVWIVICLLAYIIVNLAVKLFQ